MTRPPLFIGSSSEGLSVARSIRTQLKDDAEITIWHEGVFGLSQGTLESLVSALDRFEFAILVLTPDDMIESRKQASQSPRDNVLFECGLFMGRLGRERTFIVYDSDKEIKIPSDLAGVTLATYKGKRIDNNLQAAVGEACDLIRNEIKRPRRSPTPQPADKSSEELVQKAAAQFFEDILSERYGVKGTSSLMIADIKDFEATTELKRMWQGLKVSRDVMISRIPGKFSFTTPNCKIINHPSLIEKPNFRKAVQLKPRVTEDNLSEFDVEITGSLTHKDPVLDFGFTTLVSNCCLMDREGVDKAYRESAFKNEYFSLQLEIPTDRAMIEITFPKGYPVEAYPGVFFGATESIHDLELYRVKDGFEKTADGARFSIDKPMLGFNYFIYWIPPSQRELDKLKRSA